MPHVARSTIAHVAEKTLSMPYSSGDIMTLVKRVDGHCFSTAENIAAELQKGTPLSVIDLHSGDDAALDADLACVMDAKDRRTSIFIIAKNTLILLGQGIAKTATLQDTATVADIIPTIAYVADVHLPEGTTEGRVLYAALKDPNARLKEIAKLQESIRSMEAALERDSRAPWDKHDCA